MTPNDHNQQTFETCIALTLQLVATVEFMPAVQGQTVPAAMLLDFATQVDRHAREIAQLFNENETDVEREGAVWYARMRAEGHDPLRVAYHALHSAAYLGLSGQANTAALLSAVAHALRALAGQDGRVTH